MHDWINPQTYFANTLSLDGHVKAEGMLRFLTKKILAVKFRTRETTEN